VTTRVLAISGSLRQASHNSQLLRLAQVHAPHGVEIEIWDGLADVPAYNEDLEGDPGEAVEDLRAAIAGADALLIATPEYNFGVPGALKNALDWASRPYGASALTGIPTAVIGASPSSFAAMQARGDLRRALALSGALVDDETVGFHAPRLTTEPDAVAAEVADVVRALMARVGVAA
jgi:chromate reductase, NAD(P)H dehydrogenase (quinone)